MENLVESFRERVKLAEAVYNKTHVTDAMPYSKKEVIAKVLDNTAKLLKEALGGDSATQRGNLQTNRKFALDITNVGYANCIATDLVLTKAMSGRSGLISYIKFVTSTKKGSVDNALIANPWELGKMTEDRINYTGEIVPNESFTSTATTATAYEPAWSPVVKGVFMNAGTAYDFKYYVGDTFSAWSFANFDADGKVPASIQTAGSKFTFTYKYDNAYIRANQLPTIKAVREEISITAKPRRIAVEYSDLAAFEYKQETGADLGKALQTQAVAEMQYEIDCELINMIAAAGDYASGNASSTEHRGSYYNDAVAFNDVCPVGVGIKDHYALLKKKIADASNNIYKRTQKYMANYIVCGANVRTALSVCDGFKAAAAKQVAGPYLCGEIDGLKVYVSPLIDVDTFYVGFNGQDLDTSAVLFAPWMGLVPTQLLGYSDGTMAQGLNSYYCQ